MENAHGKGYYGRPEPASTVPIKIPKNIRQIGTMNSHSKVIYVEDYVMTFIKQLSERDPGGCKVAVLLGYYAKTEGCKNIFIKGAIEMKNIDLSAGVVLTDEGWTGIYENIKKYFTDVEIIGWALTGPEFYLDSMEKIKKVHMSNFSGPDKTLLKLDSMEKEENFYVSENNQLVSLDGYYIYYEKNEEMQNYMVENKEEDTRVEASYEDHATKKIRSIIKDKKEVKDDRNVVRLLYAASSLLAIIVLVIAATMLDNYDKMKNMESALNSISESLAVVNNQEPSLNETKETMSQGAQNITAQPEEDKEESKEEPDSNHTDTLDVETVPGEVKENDTEETKEDENKNDKKDDTDTTDESATDVDTTKEDTTTDPKPQDKKENTTESSNTKKQATKTETPTRYYTVEAGDSLAGISYKLYETYAHMDKIKELNGIEDENMIYAGQKLIVP